MPFREKALAIPMLPDIKATKNPGPGFIAIDPALAHRPRLIIQSIARWETAVSRRVSVPPRVGIHLTVRKAPIKLSVPPRRTGPRSATVIVHSTKPVWAASSIHLTVPKGPTAPQTKISSLVV